MRHRPPSVLLPYAATLAACAATTPVTLHGGHDAHHHPHGHRFDDAARWTAVFDNPERDAWQRPDEVMRALALAPDARVADVGAGTGYFSVRLAASVPRGRVWAIDLEAAMVQHLRTRAAQQHLENLFAVLCTADDAMIPERVDVVLLVDTNHHIDDRVAYYRRLTSSLRANGRVVIVDYTREAPEGPPPEMRLAPEQVDAEMTAAGYARDGEAVMLPRQYVLTYRVRGATP
jgi:cyclopropane fatty-acyl-phospholipid synthase-like methyltransferase